ncbi:MAG: peptidoglycan-binding protein [Xanthobacteraceae bacterium]
MLTHPRLAALLLGLSVAGAPATAALVHARAPAATSAVTPSAAPQKAATKKPAAKPAPAAVRRNKEDADPLAEAPSFSAEAVGWQLIEDAKTGARLGVPEKLTPHVGAARSGTRWASTQGQIQIETFRLAEAALPALFDEEKKTAHRQISSSNLKPDSFVILGVQGLKYFLVRAEARGGEVRGVTVLYDQATEGTMSRVALAVANAFVGFPDPNAVPPAGLRRRVEYGSAIVVSGDGNLVAPARIVDQCEAITVPPYGHADRVGEDKTNGLALIRLYGARNLVPAPFAETNMDAGELMLVGVPDPLAQGGDAATAVAAHLSAQGVEPAPKLGFSGAAAADARGRLVGMVDLRPAVMAGSGAGVSQAGTMVPVETIRAFLQAQLQAQHVAPAVAASAPINQSVLRVICVRK